MFNTPELKQDFEKCVQIKKFDEDHIIIEPGQYIKFIPIVKNGCIRVVRQDDDGNEIFLYHIMPGETCALSLTCCSNYRTSEVKTIAEENTQIWAIPVSKYEEWQKFSEWRDFIGLSYQKRFEKLLNVIDDIAFNNLDNRILKYLLHRANATRNDVLHVSHEEIARELNIQRESATRLLKKLKKLGIIETGRNKIKILKKTFEL
ncbi:MAG: Crp/Fnr family transcriptional regulator [Bacteroidetes bacterium]|nr:Crp/Fnr family transcriptional regulator [Bacteroidota bacterium]